MTFFYLNERFKRLFESYAHESVQRKRYVTSKRQIFVRKCSETVGREKEMRGINPRISLEHWGGISVAGALFLPAIRTAGALAVWREARLPVRPGPTGDRRNQQDLIAILECILLIAQEANILLVHIEVDEPPHVPRLIAQVRLQRWKRDFNLINQLRQIARARLNLFRAIRVLLKRIRQQYSNGHFHLPIPARSIP
jgi:hypothetical protein